MLKYMTFSYPSPTVSPFVKKNQNNSEPFLSKLFVFFFFDLTEMHYNRNFPLSIMLQKQQLTKYQYILPKMKRERIEMSHK